MRGLDLGDAPSSTVPSAIPLLCAVDVSVADGGGIASFFAVVRDDVSSLVGISSGTPPTAAVAYVVDNDAFSPAAALEGDAVSADAAVDLTAAVVIVVVDSDVVAAAVSADILLLFLSWGLSSASVGAVEFTEDLATGFGSVAFAMQVGLFVISGDTVESLAVVSSSWDDWGVLLLSGETWKIK